MDEYIVSARKYRPLTFDSVVGQRPLTTTLKNAIATGKLAHAYLFCGPRGVGKTTCARIFAKAINCLNPQADGDACGECESCCAFNEQRSMNIHELDAASNNSVEDIRELCKQVLIPPQIGRYKVFIIDEVHMLSSAAFNAFLKTLEEPPSYVIFILATTEKHKILPTILSRCQVYDFQRMTTQDTIEHLQGVAAKEGYTAETEALSLIAQKADGGMRDALSIFDQMVSFTGGHLTYDLVCQNLNVLSAEYYFRLVDHFLKNEVEPCLLLLNEILQKGFDGGNFIAGLASHMRDLLVSRDAQTLPLLEASEQMRQRYHEQAVRCQPRFLYRAIKLCNDCDQSYRTSRNKRLQLEICLIQAAQLTEDDKPGAGLRPEKILKPIFERLTASQRNAEDKAPTPPATPAPTATATPRASLPKVHLKAFGLHKPQQKQEGEANLPHEKLDTPLTPEHVYATWLSLANQLPQQYRAMTLRMKSMKPVIVDEKTLQVTANSEQVKADFGSLHDYIVGRLRQLLQNDFVELDIQVAAAEVVQRIYSKPERLRHMMETNPAIRTLTETMDLELE